MITAIIIAKNEEAMIRNALESVSWVDEIIVIDNGSSDNTAKIAQKHTSKIIKTDLEDFAQIRDLGAKEATGDWLLFVDADERVSAKLKTELVELTRLESSFSAYAISRKNYIFGQEVSYGPFWPDWVVRFIKKDQLKMWVGMVHEYPKLEGEIGYTNNSLIHLTHRNVDQIVLKSLSWSKIDAKLRLAAHHPKMNGLRLIRILITELINQGLIRRGFFNGTVGVSDALLQTFSLVITYIRLYQMQQNPSIDQKYEDIERNIK